MTATLPERLQETRDVVAARRRPQPSGLRRPPGPRSGPLVAALATRRLAPYRMFADISRRYAPVGYLRLGGEYLYVVSDPDLIWQAFVTDARSLLKGRGLQLTRPLLGNGLLTSEGAEHMRNRRLVQPVFHHQRIAGYADDMVAAIDVTDQRWRATGAGAPLRIDVVEQMSALTLDVVGRTLFGTDLSGEAHRVGPALDVVLHRFTRSLSPVSQALLRVPTPSRRRLFAAIADLDAVIAEVIQEKRTAIAAGRAGGDIVSLLLQTVDDETGAGLTDTEVRDETMTMVLAGHETTAMALSWLIRDLTLNPAALEWLREEIDHVPAADFAALAELPRTRAVVAEAMRLHPPAWILGRYATATLDLAGYDVPPGSTILASQYAMHRDPRFWPDAATFEPRRWLTADGVFSERAPGVPRGTWFPFGFGSRRCIGEQFAWLEAVLATARLLRRWDIDVVAPAQVRPLAAVTMRPASGMEAVVRPR